MKLKLHTGFRAAQKAVAQRGPDTTPPAIAQTPKSPRPVRPDIGNSEGVPNSAAGRRAKQIKKPAGSPFGGKAAPLFTAKANRY